MSSDAFSGAWRVRETVFSPVGRHLGEVQQRRSVEDAGDGRLRVLQHCWPDAALRDAGHPLAAFGGEHVFTLSRHGAVRRYHGPAVLGGALTIDESAMIGRGVWPHFGWVFTSWGVLAAPNRQITGGRFHRGGGPMAIIVGVGAPEQGTRGLYRPDGRPEDEAPQLGHARWPGECARTWKGTRCQVDAAGRILAREPWRRHYASPLEWSAADVSVTLTERDDAFALKGELGGRPLTGFARRFAWMVEGEAVVGDDTIVESIEVFDELGGHLVVLQRWFVDQTLQRAEVLRLRPEAET